MSKLKEHVAEAKRWQRFAKSAQSAGEKTAAMVAAEQFAKKLRTIERARSRSRDAATPR